MNIKLLEAMRNDNHELVLTLVAKAEVEEHPLIAIAEDEILMEQIVELAMEYLEKGVAKTSHMGTWETLIGSTELAKSIEQLRVNPSLVLYTKTILLIVSAILYEEKEKN